MKTIVIAKDISGGIGVISLLIGVMSIDGYLQMEKSIIPTLVLLAVGFAFIWFYIVLRSYEEYKIAEADRVRRCLDRYGRTIHVPGARRRG